MSKSLRAFAVVILTALGSGAQGQEPLPRPEDLVAGYRQNRFLFQNMRLVWLRRHGYLPGWHANMQQRIKQEEAQAARPGETPESAAQHRNAAGRYRKVLAMPESTRGEELLQEYLGDRANSRFQMRVAPAGWVKDHPSPPWGFPQDKVTADSLRGVYERFFIYAFDKGLGDSYRAWAGLRRDDNYLASVLASPREMPTTFFPPLAVEDQNRGKQWHPLDEFFSWRVEEMNVLGKADLDGHATYVLEHLRADPFAGSYLPEGRLREKYKDRYKHMFSTRAWIDTARGCLPLRITREAYFTLDGRVTQPPFPLQTLEQVAVERVEGGGYYPVKGVIREWTDDETVPIDYFGSDAEFEKLITGERRLRPRVAAEEVSWHVGGVRVNCTAPDDFALPFPEKTLYADEIQRKTLITGEGQTLLDNAIGPEGKQQQFEPADLSAPVFTWLVSGNLVCVALLGGWFLFRRRASRRRVA